MREFFKLDQNFRSTVIGSNIGKENIVSSVVIASTAEELNIENCVVIGSAFKEMSAKNSLLYSVCEEDKIRFPDKTLRSDVWLASEQKQLKIYGEEGQETKKLWDTLLSGNSETYEEIAEKFNREDIPLSREQFSQLKQSITRLQSV